MLRLYLINTFKASYKGSRTVKTIISIKLNKTVKFYLCISNIVLMLSLHCITKRTRSTLNLNI